MGRRFGPWGSNGSVATGVDVASARMEPRSDAWYAKKEVTFSDAIAAVRRLCWTEVLKRSSKHGECDKTPERGLRLTLLEQLCRAA